MGATWATATRDGRRDGETIETARLATDVSRWRLASGGLRPATVGTVGAAEAGDIRMGADRYWLGPFLFRGCRGPPCRDEWARKPK